MTNAAAKMTFLPLVGRTLLALLFLLAGVGKLMAIKGTAGYMASKGIPMSDILVYAVIALEIVGAIMIIIGYKTWIAALALAVFTVLAILIFHRYWELAPDAGRMVQYLFFWKDLAIAGALMTLAYTGPGPMSLDGKKGA